MIIFTAHAISRMRERHPDWSENDCRSMAELAISCGKMLPGNNGCRRYRFLGKEFAVNENNGNPIIVTVV
ncbi:hypothetical protein ES705_21972 [subsurface metagenome]